MKHCIIIGAGPGLGEAVARKFGVSAFTVSLVARNEATLRAQAKRLSSEGIDVRFAVGDAGDEMQLRKVLKELES